MTAPVLQVSRIYLMVASLTALIVFAIASHYCLGRLDAVHQLSIQESMERAAVIGVGIRKGKQYK